MRETSACPERSRSPHYEMAVFATAVGLLALHTITDVFLAPQRGTAWSDHLAAGLVPLALLAAAAFAFRRARPGLRGLIAAVLGVLAIEGALLAVADITRGNGRASDWTGFLLGRRDSRSAAWPS